MECFPHAEKKTLQMIMQSKRDFFKNIFDGLSYYFEIKKIFWPQKIEADLCVESRDFNEVQLNCNLQNAIKLNKLKMFCVKM